MKTLLLILGFLSVALGIAGIILPVLPTTPFLLLAAFLFGKSCDKCHEWLMNHKWFGETLREYKAGKGLKKIVKIRAIVIVWLSIGASSILGTDNIYVRVVLVITALSVSAYLLSLPTASVKAESSSYNS
jgi:uncharacterized membrane protein YbaN (DUF454 family)